jgi:transposase
MYPSDLSDEEWALLAPFFQRPDPRGNPGKYANRAIMSISGFDRTDDRSTPMIDERAPTGCP